MREIGIYKEKEAERKVIEKQVNDFLEKGGKIKEIELGVCVHSSKLEGTAWRNENYEDRD